jgi:hypothetical protein
MHCLRYNVGIMNDNLQLTIRGVDLRTKQQLTQLAARRGVSLNSLVIETLKQTAGTNTKEDRLRHIRDTLHQHRINSEDILTAETAIAEMDAISKAKQKRDEQ